MISTRIWALIVAAGSGTRAKSDIPKQFLALHWEGEARCTVLDLPLQAYQRHAAIEGISLVYPAAYQNLTEEIAGDYPKVRFLVQGGKTRQESVCLGLASVPAPIVIIHDAARPILYAPALDSCIDKMRSGARAVVTVFHPSAGMLLCRGEGAVKGILGRDEVAYAQCPVAYYTGDLMGAFAAAEKERREFRDEATLIAQMRPDIELKTVQGHQSGFKLTYPGDLEILRIHLARLHN